MLAERARPMTRGEGSDPWRGLALGITIVGAAAVLYFALFPFDFVDQGRSWSEIVRRFRVSTGSPWALREVPANVLLTMPLGFGLGGLLWRRSSSTRSIVLGAAMGTLVLSCGVELVQSAWLLRKPSLDDIVANTAGGAIGAWLWATSASRFGRGRERAAALASPVGRPRVWLLLGVLPAVLLLAVTFTRLTDTELTGWDRRFPIVLGNEATGDRPWRGSISRVALADRALASDEVAELLDGARMSQIAPRSVLVDLDFGADPAVPPGWRLQPTDDGSSRAFSTNGLELGTGRWMQSDAPAGDSSRRIDAADAFTVLLDATAASPAQTGPARLLSISSDPRHTNLTVAQEGSDLVVRVRTAFTGDNGISPAFVVPGVFRDHGARRLVVTYRRSAVSVAVDHVDDTTTVALLPETVPLVDTFTDDIRELRFSALGNAFRQLAFAAILFAPWTAAVVLVARAHGRWRRGRTLALVVVPIVAVEVGLVWTLPGHAFRLGVVLTTAATAALVVTFSTRRPARRA